MSTTGYIRCDVTSVVGELKEENEYQMHAGMLHTAASHCTLYLKEGYIVKNAKVFGINLKLSSGKTRVYMLDIDMKQRRTKLTMTKEELDWDKALSYIVTFLRSH